MDKRELSETFRRRLGQVVQRSGDTHAQFARDADGSLFRPHRVNPKTGMYRGRQVLDVEV